MNKIRISGMAQQLCALSFAMASMAVSAEGLTLNAGMDYSSGRYGSTTSTDILYMPFSASYESGRLSYKLTVPFIRVTGNGSVIPSGLGNVGEGGAGSVGAFGCAADNRKGATKAEDNGPCAASAVAASSSSPRTTESGVGDVVGAVTYNLIDNQETGVVADITGRVKLGTASETKNLGSGKTDYALQGYVEKSWGAPSLSLGLGYKWLGRSTGSAFDGVKFGSFGGGYKLSKEASLGVSYDWSDAAVSGGVRSKEFSVYGSYRLNQQYKINATLYHGLSDASPDNGGGISVSYSW